MVRQPSTAKRNILCRWIDSISFGSRRSRGIIEFPERIDSAGYIVYGLAHTPIESE